jgi:small subunit ribosomal protein S20
MMPNIKSAKKRVLTNAKKKIANSSFKASMRTAMKNVEKTVKAKDKENVDGKLKDAVKKIDKAVSRGLIHKNKAARDKSRLTKIKNNIE